MGRTGRTLTNVPVCYEMVVRKLCMWGQQVLREFSILSTQFCCEPKTALKIKFID